MVCQVFRSLITAPSCRRNIICKCSASFITLRMGRETSALCILRLDELPSLFWMHRCCSHCLAMLPLLAAKYWKPFLRSLGLPEEVLREDFGSATLSTAPEPTRSSTHRHVCLFDMTLMDSRNASSTLAIGLTFPKMNAAMTLRLVLFARERFFSRSSRFARCFAL